MKRKFLIIAMAAACMALAASCEKTEKPDNGENENQGGGNGGGDNTEIVEGISGAVSGVWSAGETIHVNGHINVPAGESLTIEEGVTVIFSSKGVGVNHVAIEFSVDGSLYCLGTEDAPVRLTVEESERTYDNTFAGLWGGIVAGAECPEMLIDHTIIEYTGGQVIEGSPAAENGYYTAGDDAYPQITTNNVDGNYVIINSVIRNGWSDGIYMMGGNAIIANNVFSANGYDGAEAVNVKSGCKVDVAGNIMYAPNTNGLKLSSSDQSEVRQQAQIQAYNNTIINSGWRRDGEKGGSIYVEENARVNVVNNLIVNCKFRAITPALDQLGLPDGGYDAEHSMIDYNFYASGNCLIEKSTGKLILGTKNSVIPNDGSVKIIGFGAFYGCGEIKSLFIPDSITVIEEWAFEECTVASVFFEGTTEQWSSVEIEGDNAGLDVAVVYFYTDIPPADDGNYWHYVNGIPTVWTKETT